MRAPTREELDTCLREMRSLHLPEHGEAWLTRARFDWSHKNGGERCYGEVLRPTRSFDREIPLAEFRVPRMPEIGSRWVRKNHPYPNRRHEVSVVTAQELPGVSKVDIGPSWARVALKHDASADEEKAVNDWIAERANPDLTVLVYREAKPVDPLTVYVTRQLTAVPDGWTEERWRARVLGLLEKAQRQWMPDDQRPRYLCALVETERKAPQYARLDGLVTTPASPRWWKGETAPKPERLGRRR